MSRGQARKTLNLAEEIARLDEKGIIHSIRNQKDLDEAASAYKDIEEVMNNQIDLVRPIYKLVPLAVIKG
jgi:tRNA-splicing ligase RtcB